MGGNDEENYSVLHCTTLTTRSYDSGSKSSWSTGVPELTCTCRGTCGCEVIDDPDPIPTWGYLMVEGSSLGRWVEGASAQETGSHNLEGVWWVPQP